MKCQIINSLQVIVSKLLYFATILENPNQAILEQVKNMSRSAVKRLFLYFLTLHKRFDLK